MFVRLKAFVLHFSISIVIALLAMLLVFRVWYPAPLHEAVGVTHIFLMVLLVDVVLGPLLTSIVYKKGKRTLVFDIVVIVACQLSALGYGLWTVAEGRPAWLVFNTDRFDLVRTLDIDERKLADASLEYRKPSWFGPKWVVAVQPTSIAERNQVLFESVSGGSDIAQRPNLYRPLASQSEMVMPRVRALDELNGFNTAEQIKAALQQWPDADGWLPLMARVKPMVVLLRKESAEVVAIVELNPWD